MFGRIVKAIVHGIGNKTYSARVKISENDIEVSDQMNDKFINSLEEVRFSDATYSFFHESGELDLNPLYVYIKRIFNDEYLFSDSSCNIARHLYESSDHPQIRPGELFVLLFDQCEYKGKTCKALGLFKSESRDLFLDLKYHAGSYMVECKDGLNVHSFEKGAVIYDVNENDGYCIKILMRSSKQVDTKYWMNDFMHIIQLNDSFSRTKRVLSDTRCFVNGVLAQDDSVTSIERAEVLARAASYLESNDIFDEKSFCTMVFSDHKQAEDFIQFGKEVNLDNNDYLGKFDIDKALTKKQVRYLKSVIKLDKNFHIYVHGGSGMIKKGYDEATGMEYYQLFFKNEE